MKQTPIRDGYWFKPKAFGFGAIPATWQGWAMTAVFVVIAALIANLAQHRSPIWLWLLVPVTVPYLALIWAKTDGGWQWRWGERD